MAEGMRRDVVVADGVRVQVAEAGPPEGLPVILLHGFPETGDCWSRLVGPLTAAGYRVLAPDQRGYGASDRPRRVAAYALDRLAGDVLGLIESTGRPRAALVGHDWGGVVAWWVATRFPDRVERLVALNAPHPVAFRRYLATHPGQWLRSWYVLLFQVPWLPEALLRRGGWAMLARALVRTARPGAFAGADLEGYRRAWSEPRAITAMLHWYRAALRHPPAPPADERVRVPALLIWGARDRFLGRGLAGASLALCDRGRVKFLEDATHWLHHEDPEQVSRLVLEFLGEGPGSESRESAAP